MGLKKGHPQEIRTFQEGRRLPSSETAQGKQRYQLRHDRAAGNRGTTYLMPEPMKLLVNCFCTTAINTTMGVTTIIVPAAS